MTERGPWPRIAAILVIGIAACIANACTPAAPAAPAAAEARGSGLQLITPAGEATGPLEFKWAPSNVAASYHLRFIDSREREIYTADLKGTSHRLPASVLDQMESDLTYFWRVDALDADGRMIEQTRMMSFLWTR